MTNEETVTRIYEAFGRGDVAGILEHLSPEVVWDSDIPDYGIPYLRPGTGHDHVVSFLAGLAENLEIHRFEPVGILGDGRMVAGVIDIESTTIPTGRRFTDLEVHLWTFDDDGSVVRFCHVADRHAHLAAWRDQDA